jgi:hypothetical protein
MSIRTKGCLARIFGVLLAVATCTATLWAAEWQVARSTGDVWLASPSSQPVSLGTQVFLRPGDKIQTGQTGRVLLVRGSESILIAPNSVVSIPEGKRPQATTILHQAGSIVLDVEKKDVEHFEIETPFLAAVVKGTRFAVSIHRYGADVKVLDGLVSVADHKTGQFALVSAGQLAAVGVLGKRGLRLEGSGQLPSIHQGVPRKSDLERVPVPAKGLGPPPRMNAPKQTHASTGQLHSSTVRISAPLGVGRLNFFELTKGLAWGTASSASVRGAKGAGWKTWSDEGSGAGLATGKGGAGGNGGGLGGDANANGKGALNGKAKGKK